MTLVDHIRAALGPVPSVEARPTLAALLRDPDVRFVSLRYEWVRDWAALEGLDFWDGEVWITLLADAA